MIISEHWLKQMVNIKQSAQKIAELLTFAGLEVESIESLKPETIKKIVVGKILEIEPHPNADRLRVCKVDVGKKIPLKIVCGASNAKKGIKVPVALVGAVLANEHKITKSEIRGVVSSGMLCSKEELGLEEKSDGLLILDKNARIGSEIIDQLHLDDHAIEVDLTPNRGDCFSVLGIAREISALTNTKLKQQKINKARIKSKQKITLSVTAKKECPSYAGRIIEDIDPEAQTPVWMQERLRRCGLRSLGPVVDVTNYVMMEMGQPMHGFDLDKIFGGIKVIKSTGKLKIKLLDETTVNIPKNTLIISDKKGPLAIAGIMGGSESAVTSKTKNIFLESAFFTPDAIAGKARELGKHTDSSHRFERGVDPGLQRTAIERATELLLEITGGKPGPVIEKISSNHLPKQHKINLNHQKLESILGLKIAFAKVTKILKSLGMKVTSNKSGWSVIAPSYRFDIKHDVDLIEEVIRIFGYHNIPEVPFAINASPVSIAENYLKPNQFKDILVDRGYLEAVTYSFVDKTIQSLFSETRSIDLANPISDSMSTMRTSLWPGLVNTIIYNQNRQQSRLRIFELGHCFFQSGAGKKYNEKNILAAAISGDAMPVQWGENSRAADFFDLKGDLEALFEKTGQKNTYKFVSAVHPALHPGKSAKIENNGQLVGWIGELHPNLMSKLDIESTIILFEIDISVVLPRKDVEFRQLSKFPSIKRDISLLVDENLAVEKVFEVVNQVGGKWLLNLELFDEYRGEGIDSGRKSLSLGLTLQESSRTLKEDEVESFMARVIAALQAELGAKLR